MRTITAGLVGYGFSAATFHAPVLACVDGLCLAAVVTSRPERALARWPGLRTYRCLDELLADAEVELVIITSPNAEHHPQARAALEAGKHVVVEKPFTITSRDAEDLIDLATRRNLILTVYHNRRWDNDFLTVRQVLASNLLGRIHTYEARFDRFRPEVRDRWREHDVPGAGILYDLGPHLIDQALQLFGPPRTVLADLEIQRPGGQALDCFHLVLGYPHLRVGLSAGMLVKAQGPRFVVHGDRGSFVKHGLDPQEEALKTGGAPSDPGWGADEPGMFGTLTTAVEGLEIASLVPTRPGCYQAFYQELARAIRDGGPPPVTAAQARDTIRMIELAMASGRSGQRESWQ